MKEEKLNDVEKLTIEYINALEMDRIDHPTKDANITVMRDNLIVIFKLFKKLIDGLK